MDNGNLQNEQASKFRQMVSQARSKKRRQKLLLSTRPSARTTGKGLHMSSKGPALRSITLVYPFFNVAPGEMQRLTQDSNVAAIDPCTLAGSTVPLNQLPTPEGTSVFPEEDYATFSKHMEWIQNPSSPSSSVEGLLTPNVLEMHEPGIAWGDLVTSDDFGLAMSKSALSDLDDLMWSASLESPHLQKGPSLSPDPISLQPTSGMHMLAAATCGQTISWPMTPLGPIPGSRPEDELLMHYLDRVFYIQYPFYHTQDRQGRGWLLSLLRRIEPAYYASLALSELDLLSTSLSKNELPARLAQLRIKDGYYDLALQGMQRIMADSFSWNTQSQFTHSLEGLISILQLLFWEIFAGGTKNWQWLLRLSGNLIPAFMRTRMSSTLHDASGQICPNAPLDNHSPSPEDDCTTKLLLGSFVSLDIIASASTRRGPFLDIDHVHVLDHLGIPLESLMGCRNSIMALISEVSALDRWKKESEVARKLSIIELAQRGGQLEERLRRELADLEQLSPPGPCSAWGSSATPGASRAHPGISRAFGLGAIAYLHVVLSGAHPELPEIAQTVADAILVFQVLRDRRLLSSVVWPFCIVGCLAQPDQQPSFQELFTTAEAPEGTLAEAYRVMEECWQARTSRTAECDWVSVMNERGDYVLLR
ncbi:hypothetical protein AbraIFM66951_008042 [Aspergillus brasiliensis]|uniref:C6 transcription factor n=1 Tax=Aspergillus brasiliensis TaxID=319629 RepID=A0A9W5YMK1_9EURO|nr:hypothetical protein AbraCBS73388_003374 [Aspergillus brasiliensis]GKZ45414.1 hypothetical protein AbraIFM66951_008042 [Aspergillus brasiliensis]